MIDKNSVSVKVKPHEIITFGIKLDETFITLRDTQGDDYKKPSRFLK